MHRDLMATLRDDRQLQRNLDDYYKLSGLAGLSLFELLIRHLILIEFTFASVKAGRTEASTRPATTVATKKKATNNMRWLRRLRLGWPHHHWRLQCTLGMVYSVRPPFS